MPRLRRLKVMVPERHDLVMMKVVRGDERDLEAIDAVHRRLCCPTGICGPTIDPALLDAQEVILRVQAEFYGRVTVERYALGQQPAKFMQQPEVVARLKAQGVAALPLTVVGGHVVKEKAYPAYEELKAWIEEATATPADEAP